MKSTPQQKAFFTAVKAGGHVVLQAGPGTGATTTLKLAGHHVEAATYLAHNPGTVAQARERLPKNVTARSFPALGRALLLRHNKKLNVRGDKTLDVAAACLQELRDDDQDPALGARELEALFNTWREWRLDTGPQSVATLLDAHPALAVTPEMIRLLPLALENMEALGLTVFENTGRVDHSDLLHLPLLLGLGRNSLPVALVDEGQDLTPLQAAFLSQLVDLDGPQPGRIILCGDPHQQLSRDQGASAEFMTTLATVYSAPVLPLSVSFRCPQRVVALVRTLFPVLESASGAPLGEVEHVSERDADYRPGEVVLCRAAAPLIRLALQLVDGGTSVTLRLRDLTPQLLRYGQLAFPTGEFGQSMVASRIGEVLAHLTSELDEGPHRERRADQLRDLLGGLETVMAVVARKGRGTLNEVEARLRKLSNPGGDVLLSSVYSVRGLEFDHVSILFPERMPAAYGDPDEERRVAYVAVTRARLRLRLVYSDGAYRSGQRWGDGAEQLVRTTTTRTTGITPG
jgi:DNA helicase II / ATP-dependent DNA helicase PcrA